MRQRREQPGGGYVGRDVCGVWAVLKHARVALVYVFGPTATAWMRSVFLTSTRHGPVLRDTSLLTWCLAMGGETEMGETKIISLWQWGNP